MIAPQHIDIHEFLATKGIVVPRFAETFISRLMHVDFYNKFLAEGYEGSEFCTKALEFMDISIEVKGIENVPDDGSLYTFASNHPLGGADGIALASIISQHLTHGVKLFVNDFLMALKGLAPLCIPINISGSQARDLPCKVQSAFMSDNHILIFPAGLCSRKIDGKIQDLPWHKTFLQKSIESDRKIVPVHFIARNSSRFYRVASFCKLFKIKTNLAMALLPDELYRARHKKFTVIFGKPIPPQNFNKPRSLYEWSQTLRESIYNLNNL